ncbi:serine hydrolase domain-containing protein [Arcanobacterium buesumense]|uniref:Beta-lactamase family protein n=1 Tax=Arcanobacterium buesumense TaxID=2722751 RepID=A0A6H2EIR9_9ACTO|nr:serine hydrolase domain-containing protein [Arcanobacterium buesumense]QJC21216.1 beta-lactamase family protein [Arcanobacterium buesumense]
MYDDYLGSDHFSFERAYMTLARATTSSGIEIHGIAGDPDTVFSLASVTKPIASWAVLVAAERGLISLDDPAGPPGSTFRHLLAHASGLPSEPGEALTAPARRRIYSNHGFDVLGNELANRVGMSIQDWISHAVLEPLGMDETTIPGSIAYSGRSSLDSLARFAIEVLHPTLISAQLAAAVATPQFPGLPGILPGYGRQKDNLWGLGFEIRGEKSPHWTGSDFPTTTFGHFGQSGSFIWIDPSIGKAGIFLGARMFGADHAHIWPELTNQMRAA